MVKLRWLKEWDIRKVGDISEVAPSSADNFVSQGFAEYVKEESEKTVKEEDSIKISEINFKLKELVNLSPLELEQELIKITESTGVSKTIIKAQFDVIKKQELKNKQPEKNFAVENFEKKLNIAFDKKNIAEHIIDLQPCYYDKARNWWLWSWKDYRWERVDETDILNAVERQANINTINSKEKNEILEALKQVSRLNAPKPVRTTLIQFKDTLVDIVTGERIKVIPQYFVTNPIPFELDNEGFFETPVMDKIFEEWVGKDYVRTLYEILAYCILPDMPIHRIFCLVGEGMNGKSKFLELLRRFIGQENVSSTELDTLLNSRFEVTRLHKKLVCQMGETNFNEMNKTSLLKKLSGGDLIGFEYKGKDTFEDKNYAKIIIATNNLPATTDKTSGFYRRWLIIDFPNQFSESKDILAEIPPSEYNALAVKCTFILKDLLQERKFTNEGSLQERMERYEAKSNFLERFVKEYTTPSFEGYITVNDFYKKFHAWSKENRHRELSETSVGLALRKLGWEQIRRFADWLNDGKSFQARCWTGVVWKNQ